MDPELSPVMLDGPLTIRGIAATRATLMEALATHATVRVDCSAAESVDLSFIQLLLAARLTAQQADKSFDVAVSAGGALLKALDQGGFLTSGDPFWSGGA